MFPFTGRAFTPAGIGMPMSRRRRSMGCTGKKFHNVFSVILLLVLPLISR